MGLRARQHRRGPRCRHGAAPTIHVLGDNELGLRKRRQQRQCAPHGDPARKRAICQYYREPLESTAETAAAAAGHIFHTVLFRAQRRMSISPQCHRLSTGGNADDEVRTVDAGPSSKTGRSVNSRRPTADALIAHAHANNRCTSTATHRRARQHGENTPAAETASATVSRARQSASDAETYMQLPAGLPLLRLA